MVPRMELRWAVKKDDVRAVLSENMSVDLTVEKREY